MDGHGTHHQRHHGVGRNTKREQRNKRGLRRRVIGRLWRSHTADIALAEGHLARLELGLLLNGVGRKRRHHRAATGQNAQHGAQGRTTQDGRNHAFEVFTGWKKPFDLGGEHLSLAFVLTQVADDLAVAKNAHANHDETDAIGQLRNIKAVARHARVDVSSNQAQQQPEQDHAHGLEQGARSQHHGTDQAQNHQRKILGRSKLEGHLGQGHSKSGQHQGAHTTCKERPQARGSQRRPSPAFACHLVAVDDRDHRGRLPREVHQDGGGRPAVLGAVVNTGQHDQRRHRRQSIGGGQQHGDGGQRADAGQHTNEGAK